MNEFELTILNYMQNHFQSALADQVIPVITALGNYGFVVILFTVIMICIPKYRKLGICLLVGLLIESVVCNLILKPLVHRVRPYDINISYQILINKQIDYSFPSGHTGATFAVASVLFFQKNKLWIPFLIFGVVIGYTRLYLYVHYPSDVLCGALLGIMSGYLASILMRKWQKKRANGV